MPDSPIVLPASLVKPLRGQYFLIGSLSVIAALALVSKGVSTSHPFADHWWLLIPLFFGVLQLIHNLVDNRRAGRTAIAHQESLTQLAGLASQLAFEREMRAEESRAAVRLMRGNELTDAIMTSLPQFQGDFYVYNAEMNTIDNTHFWHTLCSCEGIKRIRIAIPSHAFKHVEAKLQSDEIRSVLTQHRSKVRLLPIDVPLKRAGYAYAMLASSTPIPHSSKLFVFSKIEPLSEYTPKAGAHAHPHSHATPWDGEGQWEYKTIITTSESVLLEEAHEWFANNWKDDDAFTIDDMHTFVLGKPMEPHRIVGLNTAIAWNPVLRLLQNRSQPTIAVRTTAATRQHDGSLDEFTIKSDFGEGTVCCQKPESANTRLVVVWLPPWGYPDWPDRMQAMDGELSRQCSVVHLRQYSMHSDEFSVSGAVEDADALIEDILRYPHRYGVQQPQIVLAGTSISAFVAAEVAAAHAEHVVGLCLLAPVLDVFDALDTFRAREEIALFTRRVYFGKRGFRLADLQDPSRGLLRFFQTQAGPSFILDLALRGAARCDSAFLQRNLGRLTQNRRSQVLIAAHRADQMTPWHRVVAMKEQSEPGHSKMVEFDWRHDIDMEHFRCDPPQPAIDGAWNEIQRFIKSPADGSAKALVEILKQRVSTAPRARPHSA